MVQFNDWCDGADTPLGNHHLHIKTIRAADRATGVQLSAAAVPGHYAAEERIARALRRLGNQGLPIWSQGCCPRQSKSAPGISGRSTRPNGSMRTAAIALRSSVCDGKIIATWQCAVTT